jgi:hypothetical protein
MPFWNSKHNSVDIARNWSIIPQYLDYYVKAYDVLTDEETVSGKLVEIAKSGTTLEGIKAELRRIERANGFVDCVITLTGLAYPDVFMGHIRSKKPIQDLGAGANHGSLTHRIQWAILAKALKLSSSVSIGDLYAGLAVPSAYVNPPRGKSFWEELVDSPFLATKLSDLVDLSTHERKIKAKWVYNARSPEFLMLYMQHHRDKAVQRLFQYSYNEAGAPLPENLNHRE